MSFFRMDKDKPYDIMRWKKAEKEAHYSSFEKKYGYFNVKHPNNAWKQYYERQLGILEKIKGSLPFDSQKAGELGVEISEIKNILNHK